MGRGGDAPIGDLGTTRFDEFEEVVGEGLRLGHDVRFVLAAVGGGAIRIARDVAQKHVRYLETVAINCDPRVQDLEEFDHRVCLAPESGPLSDTGGSPLTGGLLARAAEAALQRIFDGATFVTVLGSLGGGAGTGALPYVLEAAARGSEVLSVFLVRPFAVEHERRAIADRALARLHFVDALVEKQQRNLATVQILDNELLARREPKLAVGRLNARWADLVADHIQRAYVIPAEASVEAARLATLTELEGSARIPPPELTPRTPEEAPPVGPGFPPMPFLPSAAFDADAELTFEVVPPFPGRTFL